MSSVALLCMPLIVFLCDPWLVLIKNAGTGADITGYSIILCRDRSTSIFSHFKQSSLGHLAAILLRRSFFPQPEHRTIILPFGSRSDSSLFFCRRQPLHSPDTPLSELLSVRCMLPHEQMSIFRHLWLLISAHGVACITLVPH